mmetsp:Transcript_13378/g.34102  ORF Transcript_13378/g.34102 Transcript_13378/m.34102 type:complete len:96 (+) Transcript_13378:2-289(+)
MEVRWVAALAGAGDGPCDSTSPDAGPRVPRLHWPSLDLFVVHVALLASPFTCADMENVYREAALLALRDDVAAACVLPSHILRALALLLPQPTPT